MRQQKEIVYQSDLFAEKVTSTYAHCPTRKGVPGAEGLKELQISEASEQERALTYNLMEAILSPDNIHQAYRQVKQNKGASGIDGIPPDEFAAWYVEHGEEMITSLYSGTYQPQAVREVEIPKPNGGKRKLGIPTVTDRIIQQAISQILSPIYERKFSPHSYGFRPGRNAHQALRKGSGYVEDGRNIVVDIDLKTFFDVVNHDRLMYRLSETIRDKRVLRLIRKYLQAGVMSGGLMSQRTEGTPQGSPLSPLLSNIVLDELDKELEKRGHKFVRYADDCNIYVRSQEAGNRVMESISNFIENKLKLKVNTEKSKVCKVDETKFLGYTILSSGDLALANQSLERLKSKIRDVTRRNRGAKFVQIISELNLILRGWLNYFQYAHMKKKCADIDGWIRRKLRCYRMKQCKRVITLQRFMEKQGVPKRQSWIIALSGKGHWRKSGCPQAHQAMSVDWFHEQGLYSLSLNYQRLKVI